MCNWLNSRGSKQQWPLQQVFCQNVHVPLSLPDSCLQMLALFKHFGFTTYQNLPHLREHILKAHFGDSTSRKGWFSRTRQLLPVFRSIWLQLLTSKPQESPPLLLPVRGSSLTSEVFLKTEADHIHFRITLRLPSPLAGIHIILSGRNSCCSGDYPIKRAITWLHFVRIKSHYAHFLKTGKANARVTSDSLFGRRFCHQKAPWPHVHLNGSPSADPGVLSSENGKSVTASTSAERVSFCSMGIDRIKKPPHTITSIRSQIPLTINRLSRR